MKKHLWTVTIGMAAALAGCGGGGGGEQTLAVSRDTSVPVDSTITSAVVQTPFSFPAGVPSFGTSAPTTVTFTSTASTPTFTVASAGETATGTTTFGSCIFTVQASTFPATSPLAAGRTVTVHPCILALNTSGMPADGSADPVAGTLVLGSTTSAPATVTVQVSTSGVLTLNGTTLNTIVTIVPLTGA